MERTLNFVRRAPFADAKPQAGAETRRRLIEATADALAAGRGPRRLAARGRRGGRGYEAGPEGLEILASRHSGQG